MPPGLTVQLDVKAHADAALARRTADALAAVLSRRPDAGRVEVLSFHAAAVKQAVSHGLAGRLVIWADYAPAALAHAPDALTSDRPHQLAAELAERRLLAA